MSDDMKCAIYFILNGKDYAFRVWPTVPRIGEEVMFHPVGGPVVYKVTAVVWGTKEPEERNRVTVNVKIEPIE